MVYHADDESDVVLLSNDTNIRNKGTIMKIDCYSETVSCVLHSQL